MTIGGRVASVKSLPDAKGPAGMQVAFTDIPLATQAWLDRWLATTR
jgi:hypothetical protein